MANAREEEGEEEGGVWFYGPYDRPQMAQLKLRNGAHRPVAFRLKCNRAMSFHIRPSGIGILQPNEAQLLTLTASPRANELENCALMLELVTVGDKRNKKKPGQKVAIDPITAWNHVNLGNLKKTAIPIYFGADATGDDEQEIVVVLINETMMAGQPGQWKRMYQRMQRRYPDAWYLFLIALFLIALISFVLGLFTGIRMKHSGGEEDDEE